MAYIPMPQQQPQGFYNPQMATPDWGAGFRDMLNRFVAMKQQREQMQQQGLLNQQAQQRIDMTQQQMENLENYRKWEREQAAEKARLAAQPEPTIYPPEIGAEVTKMFNLPPGTWEKLPAEGQKELGDEYLKRSGKETPEEKLDYYKKQREVLEGLKDKDKSIHPYNVAKRVTDEIEDRIAKLSGQKVSPMQFLAWKEAEGNEGKKYTDFINESTEANKPDLKRLHQLSKRARRLEIKAASGKLSAQDSKELNDIYSEMYPTGGGLDTITEQSVSKQDLDPDEDIYGKNGKKYVKRNGKYLQIIE